jgi:hypothetical protein
MRRKRIFQVKIKGISWKFRVLSNRTFKKNHPEQEFEFAEGITNPNTCVVDFKLQNLTIPLILHELSHVYYFSCLSTNTKKEDIDETHAKIWELHYFEAGQISKQIYDALKSE